MLPGFHGAVEEFFARMGRVADELMEVLCVGLGLAPRHLHDVFGERPLSFAKLISYPPTPPGEAGVNAHHDAGFLTLLLQHGVGGLQVLNPAGDWIDVPPRDDAFVVNLGEMLQEMTGNYFVATTHRVIADRARFSSGYFHGPDLRTRLDPLPLGPEFAARRRGERASRRAPGSWPSATSSSPARRHRQCRAPASTASSCGTTTSAATRTTSAPTTPISPSSPHSGLSCRAC